MSTTGGFGRFATVTPFYAARGRTTLCISIFETYTSNLGTNLWEGGEVTGQACSRCTAVTQYLGPVSSIIKPRTRLGLPESGSHLGSLIRFQTGNFFAHCQNFPPTVQIFSPTLKISAYYQNIFSTLKIFSPSKFFAYFQKCFAYFENFSLVSIFFPLFGEMFLSFVKYFSLP